MTELKYKLLGARAVAPKYATEGAGAFDLTTTRVVERDDYVEYYFDIAFEIPKHHVGILIPRSSVSTRGQLLANGIGVIDSDYRGEVTARFVRSKAYKPYDVGDRVVQMMIIKLPFIELKQVKQLGETDRDTGGYGSTGK